MADEEKLLEWAIASEDEIENEADRVREAFSKSEACYVRKNETFYKVDPETFDEIQEVDVYGILGIHPAKETIKTMQDMMDDRIDMNEYRLSEG